MASTNKTTNYELSQFVETDRPAWLTDYNGDMRKLDTALKAVSDVASGASGSLSSLTDRMTAAEGAITTNANDIDALEARADALEAQAQSTAGTIAGIQTEQITQNAGIEAATELGYNLARPYDSASTYAVGDYVLFQNTLYKCVTAIATGEAFDPTKWLAIKATDEIASGGASFSVTNISSETLFTPDTSNCFVYIGSTATQPLNGQITDVSALLYKLGNVGIVSASFNYRLSSSFAITNPLNIETGIEFSFNPNDTYGALFSNISNVGIFNNNYFAAGAYDYTRWVSQRRNFFQRMSKYTTRGEATLSVIGVDVSFICTM